MGSTIIHPGSGDPPLPTLAFVAGLAVFEALLPAIANPVALRLKWPNDIMLSGAKLSGMLLEGQGGSVVLGIGVNLAAAPDIADRKTIALSDVGTTISRDAFAEDLAHSFGTELERWRTYGTAPLLRRWTAAAHPEGTAMRVHGEDAAPVEGTFAGLGADGALMLRLADGSTRAIHAGDVMLG